MESSFMLIHPGKKSLLQWALVLAVITVFYNILEGLVSVYFGIDDETIALFGFGLDSFVEVISGIGIWHMIARIRRNGNSSPDRFEQRALRTTGTAFYILTAGLLVTALVNLYQGHRPETTVWGIIVAAVSIITMWLLIHYKMRVGKGLESEAIIADANCTKTCLYLSFALLAASVGYELTGFGGLDSAGALIIAIFSFREGREAFDKAKGKSCGCSGTCAP
jgi:divalent metal cation (Fe/Co/Zn/Cd) transporter